jgi:ATP-dependent DNA helicase Rep
MPRLNPEQTRAVQHSGGPLLVLAGAGSGKTSVIVRRIAHLIGSGRVPAQQIAAVTFTNKAAREMKQRVGAALSRAATRGLRVSTFHQLGLGILRRTPELLGLRPGFSLFDAEDTRGLLQQLQAGVEEAPLDAAALRISQWKNLLVSPEQARSRAADDAELRLARLYRDYRRALAAYNAVDFDDLIGQPIRLFTEHPEQLAHWRRRTRHLLVDEYQDTNRAQYELIRLLVAEHRQLTVVGDDDQSIYAWRGARPENLAELQRDFPDLEVVKLEQNYRCTGRILKAANALIANNEHLFAKTLWCDRGRGDPIRVIRCASEDAEAERVVNEILQLRAGRGLSLGDCAVLYRSNHQARPLEMKLRMLDIPYQLSGGTSFYARAEIRDLLAYLRLLVNPDDDTAFLRAINRPRRQIGATTLERLGGYAGARGLSLYAACGELGLGALLESGARERLLRFRTWLDNLAAACARGGGVDTIRTLLEDIDYAGWVAENAPGAAAAEARLRNVELLVAQIASALARQLENEGTADLATAIGRLLLVDLLDRRQDAAGDDRVQLLTLHAAKGLEFPHVFMIGLEEGLLPHRNSLESGDVAEERRLAYVGITRARETLTLTLAERRRQGGEAVATTPSRFLDELPVEELEREGFGEPLAPDLRRARGAASLAAIKALLD